MNEPVYLRNTAGGSPWWIPGVVKQQTGSVSYKVLHEKKADQLYRRHADKLRPHFSPDTPKQPSEEESAKLAEQAEVYSCPELIVPETLASDLPRPPEPPDPVAVALRHSQCATPQCYNNLSWRYEVSKDREADC